MTVVLMAGFEGAHFALDGFGGAPTGSAAYDSGTARTGSWSLRCNPASGAAGSINAGGGAGTTWVHFGFYIATMPSVTRRIAGDNTGASLALNSSGNIIYRLGGVDQGTGSTALTTGRWYWVGYRLLTGSSVAVLQVDGIDQGFTASPDSTGNGQLGCTGTEASAIDVYYDDTIRDDAGFLAPSKVDFALPISDNTVTGVTDGNGGTSNLWDCVNNTPPAGVASANEAANPTANIRYPASVTENYIANLESYTTLSIGASDTILGVEAVVQHGEDIATGTKNFQNMGELTNPTLAGASIAAGGDSGAHGAISGGLWTMYRSGILVSPSVTLGTSPTIRTSRTSQSRVACIDFMGMVVAWTPGPVVDQPFRQTMTQVLSH